MSGWIVTGNHADPDQAHSEALGDLDPLTDTWAAIERYRRLGRPRASLLGIDTLPGAELA